MASAGSFEGICPWVCGSGANICICVTACKQLCPLPLQTISTLKGRVSELQWSVMNQEMQVKSLESEKQELKEQLALQHK